MLIGGNTRRSQVSLTSIMYHTLYVSHIMSHQSCQARDEPQKEAGQGTGKFKPVTSSCCCVCCTQTVDIDKALGKPHSLWCAFAKFYEYHGDIANARVIFEKAVQVPFKYVDDLAQVGKI